MSEAFWNDYNRLVARLMPPLAPGDGVPEAEIAAAEARIGLKLPIILRLRLKLPPMLREFYALAGSREDINGASDRLLPLGELEVEDHVLVFYEENQSVFLWGLDLTSDDPDPPVLHSEQRSTRSWEPEHNHLSDFLTAMLFWQAVNGGMSYNGIGTASSEAMAEATGWEAVDLGGDPERWGNCVRMRDGQVLFIVGNEPDPQVYGGGRTRDDFLALAKAFGISWDYSTLDEEPDEDDDEDSDE